jgi:hypothetical protein
MKEIEAKDCIVGETYMLDLTPYGVFKMQIVRVSKTEDNKGNSVCLGVKVKDERIPGITMISGGTILKEMNDEYYNNAKKLRKQ